MPHQVEKSVQSLLNEQENEDRDKLKKINGKIRVKINRLNKIIEEETNWLEKNLVIAVIPWRNYNRCHWIM